VRYIQLGKDGSPDAGRDAQSYGAISTVATLYLPVVDFGLPTTLKYPRSVEVLLGGDTNANASVQIIAFRDDGASANIGSAFTWAAGRTIKYWTSAESAYRVQVGIAITLNGSFNLAGNPPYVRWLDPRYWSSSPYEDGSVPTWDTTTGRFIPTIPSGSGAVGTDSIWDALGDIVYGTGPNTGDNLPGNTSTSKRFLTQTGTGSASAAPTWAAIVSNDLPATVVETGDADWVDLTDGGATTLHSHAGAASQATIYIPFGDDPTTGQQYAP
jgi:hypothetical protein